MWKTGTFYQPEQSKFRRRHHFTINLNQQETLIIRLYGGLGGLPWRVAFATQRLKGLRRQRAAATVVAPRLLYYPVTARPPDPFYWEDRLRCGVRRPASLRWWHQRYFHGYTNQWATQQTDTWTESKGMFFRYHTQAICSCWKWSLRPC